MQLWTIEHKGAGESVVLTADEDARLALAFVVLSVLAGAVAARQP